MNIEKTENGYQIKCSYAPRHISRFRTMGGKWQAPYWVFPPMSLKMITDYVSEQWGLGDADTDVLVPVTDERDGQAYWIGYVLASRKGRDWAAQLVDSTGCDQPIPSSGGSMKSPRVNAPSEARFALRIPREFAVRHGLLPEATTEHPQAPVTPNPLAQFTSEQLLDELRSRGITIPA
jgi:hypothetical protein